MISHENTSSDYVSKTDLAWIQYQIEEQVLDKVEEIVRKFRTENHFDSSPQTDQTSRFANVEINDLHESISSLEKWIFLIEKAMNQGTS